MILNGRGNMPEWDEWNGLSEEQRRYSMFQVLNAIYRRLGAKDMDCSERERSCQTRFEMLERRKIWHPVASMIGGIIGGIIAVVGGWAFWKGPVP